jgi:predicted transposase YbfD/YdcC
MAIMDQKEDTERCELKAAQELLQAQPGLDGFTVTADPLHCQKQSARIIAEKGGEYFLQIKGNQPNLLKKAQQQIKPSPFLPRSIMGMDG